MHELEPAPPHPSLWQLFYNFAMVGLFGFGGNGSLGVGSYQNVAQLQSLCVSKSFVPADQEICWMVIRASLFQLIG